LLWKRTRVLALIVLVGFHLMNSWLFPIGIFPWFCIAMAFLFCDPSWPRVIWGKISGETGKVVSAGGAEGAPSVWGRRTVLLFLMLWFTWQTLFPLRHFLYPGHVLWTDEGHRFAWQMRLRLKQGDIKFFKIDPVLETPVLVDLTEFIERHQYSSMRYRPEMILQTAQWIADRVESEGYARPEVNVMALARLNGRPAEVLIDPRVDLAKEKRDPGHVEWVMPMTEAMPRWWRGEGELESR
jgi:vitamin K-dependent gamma-carboxylase